MGRQSETAYPDTANRLRAEMDERHLSYRELAFLTDFSPSYLCRLANYERRPSRAAGLRIAKALKISPARLWSDR